jgi:hypothetical protein
LWRWCTRGCRGIRLEHIRLGRRILTSKEAINRFGNKLALKEQECYLSSFDLHKRKPKKKTGTQRHKAIQEAERELRVAGVGQEANDE